MAARLRFRADQQRALVDSQTPGHVFDPIEGFVARELERAAVHDRWAVRAVGQDQGAAPHLGEPTRRRGPGVADCVTAVVVRDRGAVVTAIAVAGVDAQGGAVGKSGVAIQAADLAGRPTARAIVGAERPAARGGRRR